VGRNTFVAAALLTLLITLPLAAQSPGPGPGPRRSGPSQLIQEYRIRDLKVAGSRQFSTPIILLILKLASGQVFNEDQLRKGADDLKKLYGSRGYVNFTLTPVSDFDEQQKIVNLTLNIDEDRQFKVNHINITGNTKTRDEVIRREILIREGQVFNSTFWDVSLMRLNRLGYFDEIKPEDVQIKPSAIEPTLDIYLTVKEKDRNR
jgi:outer membrane protein insertion porin family